MKTQNIMSGSISGLSLSATEARGKSASADGGFAKVMDKSLTGEKRNSSGPVVQKDISAAKTKVNSTKQLNSQTEKQVEETVKDGSAAGQQISGEGAEDSSAVAKEVEAQVKQLLKDVTGLSDEELEQNMLQFGFTVADFFDISALQQFVVNINGGDELSFLLTDENASSQFGQLLQGLTQLEEQFPDIQNLLDTISDQLSEEMLSQSVVPEEQNFAGIMADQTEKQDNVLSEPGVAKNSEQTTEQAPVIVVEKETGDASQKMSGDSQSQMDMTDMHNTEDMEFHSENDNPVSVFAQNLVHAQNSAAVSVAGQSSALTAGADVQQMMDIVNQVVEQIKISLKEDSTSMDMMLNPESLGRLQLTVESKGGVMTANFVVQSEVAKEAVESQIQVLKTQLEEKNIKVDAVEVNVSDFDFEGSAMAQGEHSNQSGHSSSFARRSLNLESLEEEDVLTEAEELAVKVMQQEGNRVDYTA